MEGWFRDPFSALQIISWICLIVSAVLVILGVQLLRSRGKPDAQRAETPMVGFEKTTQLVTTGLYRYIWHPLYSSLLFLAWGVFCKGVSWPALLLAVVVTISVFATARMEESENKNYFGSAYTEYMKRSKMFVPFIV